MRTAKPVKVGTRERPRGIARSALTQLLTLLIALLLANAAAQTYRWLDVEQVVTIGRDGIVTVDDTRTLTTSGDFGEAFLCIHLEPGQSVTLLPGSGAVSPGPSATALTQRCNGGIELVVRHDGGRRVKERRVRFHYQLEGAIDYYSDVVQWYWQILESDHPPVRGYSLIVNAPGPMSEPYDAYVHRFGNPERPAVALSNDRSGLSVSFDRVPDGDGVEIRYLMDPALFDTKGSRPGFEVLLRDEAEIARVQTLQGVKRKPLWGVIPLAIASLFGGVAFRRYRRLGREPHVESMKYPFEPPSDLPPAAAATIAEQRYSGTTAGAAFHATIMDLMRRGYGRFEQRPRKKVDIQLNLEKDDSELLPFEAEVLSYLKGADRDGTGTITHEQLRAYSQKRASAFVQPWGKRVRSWLEGQRGGQLTTPESVKAANRTSGTGILLVFVLAGLAYFLAGDARIMMIVGAVVTFVVTLMAGHAIPAWRPEIAEEVEGWRGLKRTLTDFTRMKDAPLDFFELWDVYYAYAAALGVAEKYLKTLEKAAPLAGVDEATMVRSATWMGAKHGQLGPASLSSLSSSISSISSALSSASASASSGGSSSGGGGGGGGGSSGGR